jgi:hypothetical protein
MVPLRVEFDGDFQDLARTVFHAKAASLAAFRDEMDLAPGNPELLQVVGDTLNGYSVRPFRSTGPLY